MPVSIRSILPASFYCMGLSLLLCTVTRAQPGKTPQPAGSTSGISAGDQHRLFEEFRNFCSLPDTGGAKNMDANAQFIAGLLKDAGLGE